MIYDLHCHSHCSDGELSPQALLDLALAQGVNCLSITDHDTLAAYAQLNKQQQLQLLPGVEFSTQWQGIGIHILGLNVNPQNDAIIQGCQRQQQARQQRAIQIAEKLKKAGLDNALEGAQKIAGDAVLARPHFARYMINSGFCKSLDQAFKKYLGSGKPCDIKQVWAELSCIVRWIKDSGGIAVLAHPHKYKMTRTKLLRFLDDFQEAGGEGIEVLSGRQDNNITKNLTEIAQQRKLLASCGSDFHSPEQRWLHLGMHKTLPLNCTPVWDKFH